LQFGMREVHVPVLINLEDLIYLFWK
jgi:hypothetical protein